MSEPRMISPLLDNFMVGSPISNHHGVSCCPAIEKDSNERYILKIISIPPSSAQIDALLLTGAYDNEEAALNYYEDVAHGLIREAEALTHIAESEGFLAYTGTQVIPAESGKGFEVYLLSPYSKNLESHMQSHVFTHLDALNLCLDLCSALSVSRRNGFLFVNLKPSNIFVSDPSQYRIGGLGFLALSSLQYASIPETYISAYTPPEICDAFSAVNETIDTYGVGMILYQLYNGGSLPECDSQNSLPSPMYADPDLCAIILKACAVNPEDRWENPTQLGQAIISYMQRNGALNTPITPEGALNEVSEDTDTPQPTDESRTGAESSESLNLDNVDYDTLTDEVSEMLNFADDLATHNIPEPVVAPEYVEVPMPEPIAVVEETVCDTPTADDDTADDRKDDKLPQKRQNLSWICYAAAIFIVIALISGGFYYYTNIYLLHIDGITISGSDNTLTVRIDTDAKDSLLQVVCSDTYGNQLFAPVLNRKAEFTKLMPNSAYSIKIIANGFHKIKGTTSAAYSTPVQTQILQFDAVTGIADGSVILSFSVDGPDSKEWTIQYFAEGEETRSATFSSHMVTLTNLTIGKEYTFRLSPKQSLSVVGQTEIRFTTSRLIKAENLTVISCMNNALTVIWDAPAGVSVKGWSVRCTGPNYSQTIVTDTTSATFSGLDHTKGYVIEVKASGMSVGQGITIPENTVTVTNFRVDTSVSGQFTLSWETSLPVPPEGWVLRYSINGVEADVLLPCSSNEAIITPTLPNAVYRIQLEDINGNVLLNSVKLLESGES